MKTFWNAEAREELKRRLGEINSNCNRQWGKMSCDEMLAHLVLSFRMTLGELKTEPKPGPFKHWPIKQLIIYWLPWPKGAPTAPELLTRKLEAVESEKIELAALMDSMARAESREEWPEHPAFGKLSSKDWGVLVYRHVDHHFKQFGV